MKTPVSILIPAYSASRCLPDTVASALAQTWPHREVIIVDGGSKADTLAVARKFESSTVKVVTQPNAGARAARNQALSLYRARSSRWALGVLATAFVRAGS